jgi:recombination protein RecR
MQDRNPLQPLVEELSLLPGVGQKSAMRMAFFMLSLPKERVAQFANVLTDVRNRIRYCKTCFNIGLESECEICLNTRRVPNTLCVVSDPRDVFAIERSGEFKGRYHVLGGLISPIDGIHPDALRLEELLDRVKTGHFEEVILALNSTIEGETTYYYLIDLLRPMQVNLTKLAYGLPIGANIDYADEMTLQKAIQGRMAAL